MRELAAVDHSDKPECNRINEEQLFGEKQVIKWIVNIRWMKTGGIDNGT
jgi:hypothetical protein